MDKWLAAYTAARYLDATKLKGVAQRYVAWINAQASEAAAIQALLYAAEESTNETAVLAQAVLNLTGNVPTVDSASPATGLAAGGTAVTLTGNHLLGTTGVTIGGVAATSVLAISDTQVTLVTGAHAAGAVALVLTTTVGSVTKNAFFTYT